MEGLVKENSLVLNLMQSQGNPLFLVVVRTGEGTKTIQIDSLLPVKAEQEIDGEWSEMMGGKKIGREGIV